VHAQTILRAQRALYSPPSMLVMHYFQRLIWLGRLSRHYLIITSRLFILFLLIDVVPGEPQDLRVIRVTSNSIELEWKPPRREHADVVSSIKGYEIQYYKVSNNAAIIGSTQQDDEQMEPKILKKKTNDIKRLKYTLTDLDPNSLYKIQIYAYNMRGDGQRSNPLLVYTMEDATNKPESVQSEVSGDTLRIKWLPPAQQLQSQQQHQQRIIAYRIYFNNEKYEVDAGQNEITFKRPKWGILRFSNTIYYFIIYYNNIFLLYFF
jgi:hypothetical protein